VRAWAQAWELIRDVGLTGFGIYLVALQSFSAHPSDALILAGVGLAVPAVRGNLKALLGGSSGGPSSRPSPGSGPAPPPSSSRAASGE